MKFVTSLLVVLSMGSVVLADVNVSGQGNVSVTPDNAVITVTIATTAQNIRAAVRLNAEETKKVTDLLRNVHKVNEADLCAHSFSVNLNYERRTQEGLADKVISFSANNQMLVIVRDTSKAGDILGAVGSIDNKNAVQINNIQFVVSDTLRDSVLTKARKLAMVDAIGRANTYANSAGIVLGSVKDITEERVYTPRYVSSADLRPESVVNIPVSAGTAKVNVSISVRFNTK